jgi:hypothetical protein
MLGMRAAKHQKSKETNKHWLRGNI